MLLFPYGSTFFFSWFYCLPYIPYKLHRSIDLNIFIMYMPPLLQLVLRFHHLQNIFSIWYFQFLLTNSSKPRRPIYLLSLLICSKVLFFYTSKDRCQGWGCGSVVTFMPCMDKVLGSIPAPHTHMKKIKNCMPFLS